NPDGKGGAYTAHEVRSFSVALLTAAPVRVTQEREPRTEERIVPGGCRFVADRCTDAAFQCEIPRRRTQRRTGERGCEVVAIDGAVVLPSIEIHPAHSVAVTVSADDSKSRHFHLGASLNVAIVAVCGGYPH